MRSLGSLWCLLLAVLFVVSVDAFNVVTTKTLGQRTQAAGTDSFRDAESVLALHVKKNTKKQQISDKRRQQLGIADDEEEYDLSMALDMNTDPAISKIIAGSLILTVLALLVVGLVIPLTADYGDGVCNPLLTQGRC